MSKQRVAIFGGSFDPIHYGHLALAGEVIARGLAAEVWLMVTPQNPHKQDKVLSDERLRFQMAQLAVEGMEGVKACDFEFSLPRPSYTLNTLTALDEAYPECRFSLLIGADNWEKFDKWYMHDEILAKYRIIVYPRGNEAAPQLPEGVTWLSAPLLNVSSTQVRTAVAAGEDISALVAPGVAEYIKENNLYR